MIKLYVHLAIMIAFLAPFTTNAQGVRSCFHIFETIQTTTSFAVDEQWKAFRAPHPSMAAVKSHVLALGHFTTYTGIFRIGRQGALKSRAQLKKEDRRARINLGGNINSSYLAPIGENQRFIYVGSSLLGPTIIFSNTLLDRKDYYFNTGADYGVFNSPNSYGEPSGFRGSWSLDRLTAHRLPKEVVFENEIRLADYAAAIVVPASYRPIFQSLTLLNGISWKKMGVEIIFADTLPDSQTVRQLVERKNASVRHALNPHDVHINIRTNLDLHLPTLESKYDYLDNPLHWPTELGLSTRNYFMTEHNTRSYGTKNRDEVLKFLEVQLRTESINWHWFQYYNITFPQTQSAKQLTELLARYDFTMADLEKRSGQRIPSMMRMELSFNKGQTNLPPEYQNLRSIESSD